MYGVKNRRVAAFILLDNRRVNRRQWVHHINTQRERYGEYNHLMEDLRQDRHKFYDYFRLYPDTFDELHELIRHRIQRRNTNYRRAIPTEEKLAVTLRYLATGVSFSSLSFTFRMGISTISGIVKEVTEALWNVLCEDYIPAPDVEACHDTAKSFHSCWNFPNVIGAVDGKHVRLQCPRNSGSNYFNYKKYFSLVLQAVAGPHYEFLFVDVGAYGKESDGGIFQRSSLKKWLDRGDLPTPPAVPSLPEDLPYVILGDAAYPLRKDLMTPYGSNLTHERKIYNYRHSRARRCVENAFGILAAKWRVLRTAIEVNVENATSVVLAAVVLHNFALRHEPFPKDDIEPWIPIGADVPTNDPTPFRGRPASQGSWIRDSFTTYFNNDGSVPWQEDRV